MFRGISRFSAGLTVALLAAVAAPTAGLSEPAAGGIAALDAIAGRQVSVPLADPALRKAIEVLKHKSGAAPAEAHPAKPGMPDNFVIVPARAAGKVLILGGPEAFPM